MEQVLSKIAGKAHGQVSFAKIETVDAGTRGKMADAIKRGEPFIGSTNAFQGSRLDATTFFRNNISELSQVLISNNLRASVQGSPAAGWGLIIGPAQSLPSSPARSYVLGTPIGNNEAVSLADLGAAPRPTPLEPMPEMNTQTESDSLFPDIGPLTKAIQELGADVGKLTALTVTLGMPPIDEFDKILKELKDYEPLKSRLINLLAQGSIPLDLYTVYIKAIRNAEYIKTSGTTRFIKKIKKVEPIQKRSYLA